MKLELAKGVRDFGPEQKMLRQEVVDNLKEIFEIYGYAPIETPIIERYEVLMAKFAAGQDSDAMKETFTLKDQGGRKLALRFDLTVPFARFVAMNPNLKMPFKRYQIERVYRDGPIKLGRYREFWQCDVDIAGSKSMMADAELIDIAIIAFKKLGLDVVIEYNNRKVLDACLAYAQVKENDREKAMVVVDKYRKLSRSDLQKEWNEKDLSDESFAKLFGVLGIKEADDKKTLKSLKDVIGDCQGLKEIDELQTYLKALSIRKAVFNPTLARGLGYYTGTVFEGFLTDKKLGISSSVCGGGRYDDLIGGYVGGRVVPATGISFGLEPITEAFKKIKDLKKSPTKIFVIPIGTQKQCLTIVKKLRKKGISADIDLNKRGISKNLKYVNSYNIPYAAIVGEDELKQGMIKLRNMKTGKETLVSPEKICFS